MKKILDLSIFASILFAIVLINSCKKDPTIPVLTTNSITNISVSSATSGGIISKDGGADITAKGVCWSTSQNPVATGLHTNEGTGAGKFTSQITSLAPNTKYYVRAYATNSVGTAYGNEVNVTTTEVAVPALTTTAVSSISFTTAVSGGTISSDGGAAVSEKGVCWATAANPTVSNFKSTEGTGTDVFTSNLTSLLPGTTYYLRSYATNSAGTAYGNEISFSTNAISAPVLTTTAITAITLSGAVSGGNITSDGGETVTIRGICWSTSVNPTTGDHKTDDGSGPGSFVSNLTDLLPGTIYHVRAFATNNHGTSYGNELAFTTTEVQLPTLTTAGISVITTISAISGGTVTSDGGALITSRGVCWSTAANPDINDPKSSDAIGTPSFVSNIIGLLPATTYHVRAYATNNAGTAYGTEVTFTTASVVPATLTTTTVTAITQISAVSGGNITNSGGGDITARGVCWSVLTNPTIGNAKTSDATGTGSFSSNLGSLLPGTLYYVKAYATNSAGTAYGPELSFTTSPVTAPSLTTVAVTSITLTSAVSGGNISSAGGGTITEKGVCWSTSAGPTVSGSKTSDGNGISNFTSTLSPLLPGTVYHIRAYATNGTGTGYGAELTFTTESVSAPTLTTSAVSSINLTSAISGGSITSDGGSAITVSGICWSSTGSPSISDNKTSDGTASGTFASTMTGLTAATTYYVRSYATSGEGTGYGNLITFNTKLADIEGNTYNLVTIGDQVWMAENLRTITLNDGTVLPNVTDNTAWSLLATPAYCWFNNDISYKPLYGAMYNWFTVNTGDLCPTGFHVPSDAEFNALEVHLGLPLNQVDLWDFRGTDQGTQLKSTTGWTGGLNGSNSSGFDGRPGGYRFAANGAFNDLGNLTYWWTSTDLDATRAWYVRIDGSNTGVYRGATEMRGGKYIRCLKD